MVLLYYQVVAMRIFIACPDESGIKRNRRLFLDNCTTTTHLIRQICKELGAGRHHVIIKLKHQPHHLILVENWPLTHYPIRNGSTFLITYNEKYHSQASLSSTEPLSKVDENDYASEAGSLQQLSFLSDEDNPNGSKYLEENLNRMLKAVKQGDLQKIASILKEIPQIQDEEELNKLIARKYQYLLNEVGDAGKNSLHIAIETRNPQIVSFLIIKGVNPRLTTVEEYTPLQLAVINSAPDVLELLLEQKGIDINQVTSQGTALHLAVSKEDTKCIQILLHNEVDIDNTDKFGKKAVEFTADPHIKKLLEKKSKLKRAIKPNISKGDIYGVSSIAYRLKDRHILLNPFKNEVTVSNVQGEIKERFQISMIERVQQVQEKSWLMSDTIFYFTVTLKDKHKTEFIFGVRHRQIFDKWISNFLEAISFRQQAMFTKPVPPNEQLIELLNDKKNQITLHRRKIEENSIFSSKANFSILNLCPDQDQLINQIKIKERLSLRRENDKFSEINEGSVMQSQIVLGSIVKGLNSTQPEPYYAQVVQSTLQPSFVSKELGRSIFRKNEVSKLDYSVAVSQFRSEEGRSAVSFLDFEILKLLGNGSFGHVYSARHKESKEVYALKVLNKKKLINKKQLKYAVGQANILKKVDFPFIINLHYAFQTPLNLYMALDHCTNGDLSELITVKERLGQNTSRFIIAQIILALEYLHGHNILYRDLKPENILIGKDGYIKVTDFGLSKENCFSMSFCGSPAYLSPQMLEKKGVGFSTDIYGIGCVLFEMLTGEPPFFDEKLDVLYENIKAGKLRYPSYLSMEAKSLISKLLEKDISKRIGVKGFNEIKSHDFFKKFDWRLLLDKKTPPPSEMFLSEGEFEHEVELQRSERIALNDTDYSESTEKLSRIKNFTFVRVKDW